MNKSDLIKLTSKKSGMSKSETTGVINSMIEVIGEVIQNGFWTFT
jgi:nucleoid DNA-binding protein